MIKYRIAAVAIVLLIVLPVSVALIRVWHARHEPAAKPQPVVTPYNPYTFEVTKKDTSLKGYVLQSPYQLYQWRHGQLVIVSMQGDTIFHRHVDGAIYDFRQWHINGHVYYSYIVNDPKVFHIYDISLAAGHVVILDSALNEIKQMHLLPHDDVVIDRNQDLDLHDFIMLSEDHYYAVAVYEKPVHNIPDSLHPSPYIKVGAPVIQEVDKGKVIWQWDATRFPEFYAHSHERNRFSDTSHTADFMHFNSMIIDPADSNLICSFRNMDQVIKIDRHTGNILWRLGGDNSDFPMKPDQKFLRQHNATLTDDGHTLMLLDNGDSLLRQTSRVLEFRLDEQHKKITSFHSFAIPEPYSQYMGLVRKEGDRYFIGGGSANYVLEVNARTGEKLFELKGNQSSYRAYKVDSLYGLEKQKK